MDILNWLKYICGVNNKKKEDVRLADAIVMLTQVLQHLLDNKQCAILEKLAELKEIVMTQAELTAALDNKTTQIVKVAKEQSDRFDVLTAKITALEEAINNGGTVSPAVETALNAVTAALDNLDAAIPDAPVPA